MKVKFLLRSFCLFLLVLKFGAAHAQAHFIYIQTDDKVPFTATVDSKPYTSSASGYLLVPQLAEGDHAVVITINAEPGKQQNFSLPVKKKDAGYGLKKYGADGWGLYSLTSSDVIMAQGGASETASGSSVTTDNATTAVPTVTNYKKSAFGDMLSQVVDDPDLTKPTEIVYQPNKKQQPKPLATPDELTVTDSAGSMQEDTSNQMPADDTTALETTAQNQLNDNEDNLDKVADAASTSGVIKASEEADDTGRTMVFIDFNSKGSDTIQVLIPTENAVVDKGDSVVSDNAAVAVAPQIDKAADSAKVTAQPPVSIEEEPKTATIKAPGKKEVDNPFFSGDKQPQNEGSNVSDQSSNVQPQKLVLTNSNCSKMLSENDVDKLRRKMFTESGYDNMIQLAKKYVKGKCVSTEQVKGLSQLFLTDESRYNFFDAMYANVYDYQSYATLESQLIDSYYKDRLKALIR